MDIIISDIGLLAMGLGWYLVYKSIGFWIIFKLYIVPWILLSHWIIMIVFLQHTDPALPHYRDSDWTFVRGSISTMDRDFLGWQGAFFLHYVSYLKKLVFPDRSLID